MAADEFSRWARWDSRDDLQGLQFPGVYAIAISTCDLAGGPFSLTEEIAYFGMTNSQAGLRGRLNQFDATTLGKTGHGGARRFMFRYPDRKTLLERLYVAVSPLECDPRSGAAPDLRLMGEVAWFEYECFARYVDRFGRLPDFNDKVKSPKRTPWPPLKRAVE